MSNRIFQMEADEPVHPVARDWLERIRAGQVATFTLWRKRDGLTYKPAWIYMSFQTPGGTERDDHRWDVDLNEALTREGVRAENPDNEAHRLSLMLRYWFSRPEEDFGPGFFEAVLIEFVADSDIANQASLRHILERIRVNRASRDSESYDSCKGEVESILQKYAARSLTQDLRYPEDEAKRILAMALGQYLDERFHITERRMLGWS